MRIMSYQPETVISQMKWQCSCLSNNVSIPIKISEENFRVSCEKCGRKFELTLLSSFELRRKEPLLYCGQRDLFDRV